MPGLWLEKRPACSWELEADMLLGSKIHTVGDTKLWTIDYDNWLDNTAEIETINVTSSSTTCTVGTPVPVVLGHKIQFVITGGTLGETLMISLKMTDSFGNVKNDTMAITVIAP
jgi:hypothetical protein